MNALLQGKLHATLTEHLGQLAAEMRSAREQYKRVYLRKRKLDDEGSFKKVRTHLSCSSCYVVVGL